VTLTLPFIETSSDPLPNCAGIAAKSVNLGLWFAEQFERRIPQAITVNHKAAPLGLSSLRLRRRRVLQHELNAIAPVVRVGLELAYGMNPLSAVSKETVADR